MNAPSGDRGIGPSQFSAVSHQFEGGIPSDFSREGPAFSVSRFVPQRLKPLSFFVCCRTAEAMLCPQLFLFCQ
jgi:hypothetical protein